MVADDHLDADAGHAAAADGGDRLFARRIGETDESQQRKAARNIGRVELRMTWLDGLHRQGENSLPIVSKFVETTIPVAVIESLIAGCAPFTPTQSEDLLGSAFRLERDYVNSWKHLALHRRIEPGLPGGGNERSLGRIAEHLPSVALSA
jgi:hypothetical protein